jgi:hypothetical protein
MHFLVRYVDFCSFLRGIRILVHYVDFCSFLRGIRILVRYVDFGQGGMLVSLSSHH